MHDPAIPERQRVTRDASSRRTAGLILVLLVVFIGIAIAKPWGSPGEPSPFAPPSKPAVTLSAASQPTTAPKGPGTPPSVTVEPLPVDFTTPLPPASPTWTRLRWRRLAADHALSLVTSVVHWRHGFVAVGRVTSSPSTPVWTSADGAYWNPLPFDTSTTFWPSVDVLGVAARETGLVAITETVPTCSGPCPLDFQSPVVAWTSSDGRTWTPHVLPPTWLAAPPDQVPILAAGPAGLVVASNGSGARLATSPDGSHWSLLPAAAFPAQFALNDLRGTATGYVAVGRWMPTPSHRQAASLWSSDGRNWSATPTILPTHPAAGTDVGSAAVSLVIGSGGMVATGRGVASPGAALWWQSADGQRWRPLPTFPPLGPTRCPGDGCSVQPNGSLVSDGQRMVAVRGGTDAGVWTSIDGLAWSRLAVTGDVPSKQTMNAVLLPGGVLLSDGTSTWFGQAEGK